MARRIVFVVSALLFTLVAVVANILADVHDRNYPDRLHASSAIYLDFSRSGLSDPEAIQRLRSDAARLGLHLFKVQPDLKGNQQGQNLVRLGPGGPGDGTEVRAYGAHASAHVTGPGTLTHSFATGPYLAANSNTNLDEFVADLTSVGVLVKREDDSARQTAEFVLKQSTFRNALLAVITLMTSMALFWLSIRAKARALRLLGGVPTLRIQAQDLGAFMLAMLVAAAGVLGAATVVVGFSHGWEFVPYYAKCLIGLQVAVAALTGAIAFAISCASWPSALLLVRREPPVQSLRRASIVLKAVTFVLVIGSAGPAWLAYQDASAVAAQQAQWVALADQVALRYPAGLGEGGFERIRDRVGTGIESADEAGDVALSYAMTAEQLGVKSLGPYSSVALVNPAWIKLMLHQPVDEATRSVASTALPKDLTSSLDESLAVWTRGKSNDVSLNSFKLRATRGSDWLPLAEGGSGDLLFLADALLVVVPDVSKTFNADFLASLTSSSNLVFDGLDPTIAMLRGAGLEHTVRVVYVAEDGILRAQYSSYIAWLRAIAMLALAVAFVIAASVSALIAAMLASRHDFPVRLSGRSWPRVVGPRLVRETLMGVALALGIVFVQPTSTFVPVTLAAAAGLLLAPSLHLLATRWCFTNLSLRRS